MNPSPGKQLCFFCLLIRQLPDRLVWRMLDNLNCTNMQKLIWVKASLEVIQDKAQYDLKTLQDFETTHTFNEILLGLKMSALTYDYRLIRLQGLLSMQPNLHHSFSGDRLWVSCCTLNDFMQVCSIFLAFSVLSASYEKKWLPSKREWSQKSRLRTIRQHEAAPNWGYYSALKL